ncbi:unnamed protein product [Caenorhabditis angaria]|uniref:Protein LLP homolog n=1 Tax=Caenorhabditis angaria TaxID=860376 RepID=A0A9P1IRJ0_9PELO|nr:unnamed protein product [Caenorhabditis angaria]
MAKSLRSKFKRKVRAIARTKKEPKAAALLQKAVEKREEYEKLEAEKAAQSGEVEKMETATSESKINVKTLKKPDGSYPTWLSGTKKKKAAKKAKSAKKGKTAKNFR